jgi:hypothetical protein
MEVAEDRFASSRKAVRRHASTEDRRLLVIENGSISEGLAGAFVRNLSVATALLPDNRIGGDARHLEGKVR